MVKNKNLQLKASFTVEAALIVPFLCLILCGMLRFTMGLYQRVEDFGEKLAEQQEQRVPSSELIRLEAVADDLF